MSVSVTKNLSAHMQQLADCREAEKLAAAEVERLKGELKTAKALWEERVADTNRAADDAIDKEREPTLFDDVDGGEGDNGAASGDGDPSTPPNGGGAGEIIDAEFTTAMVSTGIDPESLNGIAPVLSLPAPAEVNVEDSEAHLKDEFGRYLSHAFHWQRIYEDADAKCSSAYLDNVSKSRRAKSAAFLAEKKTAESVGELPEAKWGKWSEFTVKLSSGETVRVAYEPGEPLGVTGEPGETFECVRDTFAFYGAAISPTGYREREEVFGGDHPRPKVLPLTEFAREIAEGFAKELATKAGGKAKKRKTVAA